MADKNDKRVAIVTGGSRGIGAEVAKHIAADGRHVVCVARNLDKLNEVVAQIEAAGGTANALTCDISDAASIEAMIEQTVSDHGRLDILVNNAGITRDNLLLRMSDEEFDDVIQTNLRSVFVACRASIKTMMRGKWGRIINIGSVSGVVGNPGQSNYAAAKAGLAGFTKSLAKEMGGKSITANVIAPGFIETDMTAEIPLVTREVGRRINSLSQGGLPVDVAETIGWLGNPASRWINGQTVRVCGQSLLGA